MIKLTEIYDNLWYAVGKIEFIEFTLMTSEIINDMAKVQIKFNSKFIKIFCYSTFVEVLG